MVEGGGFEPPKAEPTDLQSVPFGRSGTPPRKGAVYSAGQAIACQHKLRILSWLLTVKSGLIEVRRTESSDARSGAGVVALKWCWREESNPRPADYKSAALPTELHQQVDCFKKRQIFLVDRAAF